MIRSLVALCLLASSAVPAFATSYPALEVELSDAATGRVAKGAQRVPFAVLTLRASCDDDAHVRAITLRHVGKGFLSDIQRAYLLDGNRRVSDARSISGRDQRLTLRPRALDLAACEEKRLVLAADISPDAETSGEHRFVIDKPENVDAGDTLVFLTETRQALPVRTAPVSEGKATLEFLPLLKTVRYGAGRTVARFRASAEEADLELHSITFTNDGSARGADLQNLFVETTSGDRLTNVASSLDGETVTLTFDPPLKLDRNAERLLELTADVRASRRRTIRLIVDEPSDVSVGRPSRTR
jgi:hypothetical protein